MIPAHHRSSKGIMRTSEMTRCLNQLLTVLPDTASAHSSKYGEITRKEAFIRVGETPSASRRGRFGLLPGRPSGKILDSLFQSEQCATVNFLKMI